VLRARHLVVVLALGGCGDEVVGFFEGSGEAGSSTSTSTSTSTFGSSSSTTGDPGFEGPGCFSDDFEDGVVDPVLWNTWIEADANLEEVGGMLKFTPPTTGIWDTGVVGAYESTFRFENATVRTRVPIPPSTTRSVVLFLQVLDGAGSLVSMQLAGGLVSVSGTTNGIDDYFEEYPADPYPAWIGVRAEGGRVHYEISNDGVSFTEVVAHDRPFVFEDAAALLMAQTYGQDLEGGVVAVDDFEVCVQ
jgi:hypothetical protein